MNARRMWVCGLATLCLTAGISRADNEMGKGVIKGVCKLEGAFAPSKPINMGQDPFCLKMHGNKPVPAQATMVFGDGTLPYVFVYVKSGLKGKYTAPETPITIDQKGCMYSPHVQGMMAGQPITIVNSDSTSHNIHALPKNNPQFNFGQPKKGMTTTRKGNDTFNKTEVMVQVKCDVHPWMSAYIGVVDNPFHATSGKGGMFEIKGIPDGEYELEAWHEKGGKATAKVTVKDGKADDVTFTFKAAKAQAGPVGKTVLVSSEDSGEEKGCCGGKKVGECQAGKGKACCKAKEEAAKGEKVASK